MITQLIIDSNCSISAITETWLTIDASALASQLTPAGFKVLLSNKYTSHRRGGLDMLFLSELRKIMIPRILIFLILEGMHDGCGHQGIERVIRRVNLAINWKGKYKYIGD